MSPGPFSLGQGATVVAATLNAGRGGRWLKILEKLDRKPRTEEARIKHDNVLDYLRKNLHCTDYPASLRRGWQIATGAIESGCKTVVTRRLCLGKMGWGEEGSDAVAHLRALNRSDPDEWDGFWRNAA